MEIAVNHLGTEKRKEYIQKKTQGNIDWITTITKKVDDKILSRVDADKMIARAMTAREIRAEIENDKAKRDPLTELYNKGAFIEEYEKLIKEKSQFALLIIDIDDFKTVNEKYGYLAADSVLMQVALNLSTSLRQARENENENDFIGRWGGEEFAVLVKNISKENLVKVAEKLRRVICERKFNVKSEESNIDIPVTVSIGGGIYSGQDKDLFFNSIDRDAIKQAKATGKNKVITIN